jgi:putative endonuclease
MKTLGTRGEEIAVSFLKKKGFKIVARNYRTVFGEIDIIAIDRDSIVFIEVKTRSDKTYGHPFEAVTRRKKEKIGKVALAYMKSQKGELPSRFDVLSISVENGNERVEHIKDAFEV